MSRTFPPFEFGPGTDESAARFVDYEAVGEKLIAWAQGGPDTWPKTIDDLRTALAGHLHIPAQVKDLEVVQGDDSDPNNVKFILRLPAKGQVTESDQLAGNNEYLMPPLIAMLADKEDESQDPISTKRMFHARVADYTMRQCR